VASISYQSEAPKVVLQDPRGECMFYMKPVDGTFPDYQRIVDSARVFEGRELCDMASVGYNSKYLKGVGEIAKTLGSDSVRLFGASLGEEPSLITFPGQPGAVLVLMPMRHDAALPQQTVKVLSGAVGATVSALRAHQTRWAQKVEKVSNKKLRAEYEAKVAEYETRILAIIGMTQPPALPAPEPATTAETGEPNETTSDSEAAAPAAPYAITSAVSSEPAIEPEVGSHQRETRANSRAKLGNGLRKKTLARFMADINAALSRDHGGLTINQLADGVPVLEWFDAGLTGDEAAVRCADWRKIETVLPPDEVGPGEAGLPCGHLTHHEQEQLEAAE
jgi:hypothetical protein